MFPHISWELDTAWTGTFAESKDGLPYIGQHKDFPGCAPQKFRKAGTDARESH